MASGKDICTKVNIAPQVKAVFKICLCTTLALSKYFLPMSMLHIGSHVSSAGLACVQHHSCPLPPATFSFSSLHNICNVHSIQAHSTEMYTNKSLPHVRYNPLPHSQLNVSWFIGETSRAPKHSIYHWSFILAGHSIPQYRLESLFHFSFYSNNLYKTYDMLYETLSNSIIVSNALAMEMQHQDKHQLSCPFKSYHPTTS